MQIVEMAINNIIPYESYNFFCVQLKNLINIALAISIRFNLNNIMLRNLINL